MACGKAGIGRFVYVSEVNGWATAGWLVLSPKFLTHVYLLKSTPSINVGFEIGLFQEPSIILSSWNISY